MPEGEKKRHRGKSNQPKGQWLALQKRFIAVANRAPRGWPTFVAKELEMAPRAIYRYLKPECTQEMGYTRGKMLEDYVAEAEEGNYFTEVWLYKGSDED